MPGQHEMMLVGWSESGAEDWHCPECGRRLLMRWRPQFEAQILEEGDPSVLHQGVKGGARLGQVDVNGGRFTVGDQEEEWLRGIGIDWDGTA